MCMKMMHRMKKTFIRGRLSEVRKKNPDFNDAALFVEDLYGRPLQNDPIVGKIPSLFFVTLGGSFMNIPSASKRFTPPPSIMRLLRSIGFLHSYNSSLVHEIVHSEDVAAEKNKNWFIRILSRFNLKKRIVLEGRATFAQHMFQGRIKRFEGSFYVMLVGGLSTVACLFAEGATPFIPSLCFAIGAVYWSFHNALCALNKKLDDSKKAFQLTTQKPPSLFGIICPTIFYKKEIQKQVRCS